MELFGHSLFANPESGPFGIILSRFKGEFFFKKTKSFKQTGFCAAYQIVFWLGFVQLLRRTLFCPLSG